MSQTRDIILHKLTEAFQPEAIIVTDDSAAHAGHAGNPGGGEGTHMSVDITATAFAGKSRIETHRMINSVLAEELAGTVHALVIKAKAPE